MKFGNSRCTNKKILLGVLCVGAIVLILYISEVFLFEFLPYSYTKYDSKRIVIEIIFYYFSIMTILSIISCAASDPGYLSLEY